MITSAKIHALVSLARTGVLGLLATVTHQTQATKDGYGEITWSAGVAVRGYIALRVEKINVPGAIEVNSKCQLLIPENIAVSTADRFILPDGTTPPIVAIESPLDDAGNPYCVKVYF